MDPGDTVEANDIITQSSVPGWIQIVDLAKALGVPRGMALLYATVTSGEFVEEGDVLARRSILGSLWQRTCVAPVSGRITDLTDGLIFIRSSPQLTMPGARLARKVDDTRSPHGGTTEAASVVLRGVWGAGASARGPLHLLVSAPGERLSWKSIGLDCKGNVVVVGAWLDRAILLRATRLRVCGIVAGGIDPQLVPEARHSSVPLLITEGAGVMPISEIIFELLAEHQGTEVLISGGQGSEWEKPGSELVLPLAAEEAQGITKIPGTRALQAGDPVRLTRPPYQGYSGTVIGAESRLTRYRSGVQCPAVWVQLSDGRRVYVPYTNLELMSA
ncbi:MAG: hypothetical protein ABIK79_17070 [Chloroflexota bacterium]|nr:hypothetical protein [Anaerolineae bacterium]